jgi:hypothetical protein
MSPVSADFAVEAEASAARAGAAAVANAIIAANAPAIRNGTPRRIIAISFVAIKFLAIEFFGPMAVVNHIDDAPPAPAAEIT